MLAVQVVSLWACCVVFAAQVRILNLCTGSGGSNVVEPESFVLKEITIDVVVAMQAPVILKGLRTVATRTSEHATK